MVPWGSDDLLDWVGFLVAAAILAVVLPVLFVWSLLDEAWGRFHGA